MLIKIATDLNESDVTPCEIYQQRRRFLQSGIAIAGAAIGGSLLSPDVSAALQLGKITPGPFSTDEEKTPLDDVTSYNNFYEFGVDKSDPARYAHKLVTDPWSVSISGEVGRPGTYTLEDILKPHALEERIYRLRCVEGWSMVIPWVGFPLADLLKRFEPTSKAKFVEFETLVD
ncbi:MAG TPA: mononuclear molybdenum enzyme YedY, partial [Gammaproteobacteria bacterium]|nr:mononuclear molybdenum enzyme YedY [Gammaproteobacteria bacterium]